VRRLIPTLLASVAVSVSAAHGAVACRCDTSEPWNPDVEAGLSSSDFVFFGQVTTRSGFDEGVPRSFRSWEFDVAAVWKGPGLRTSRVFAHSESNLVSSCDREFKIGETYVVFAYLEPGASSERFRAGVCSLTSLITSESGFSHDLVRRLGDPKHEPRR